MSKNNQLIFISFCVAACLLTTIMLFKSSTNRGHQPVAKFPESQSGDLADSTAVTPSGASSGGVSDLFISTTQIDFGRVTPGEKGTATLLFTNTGEQGSADIVIDQLFLDELDSQYYSLNAGAPVTLAPSESFVLVISFEPDEPGLVPGRLIVNHTGKSGVNVIDLFGEGFAADGPILSAAIPPSLPFGKSTLTGFNGAKPTSLQFGPDGRLYVASMYGEIYALDIERVGANEYSVISTDTITLVKDITNHNDDGSEKTDLHARLVTGLLVTGSANKPVIYVQSSDPRIGGGNSGRTTNLDTNSGILSRLTKTSNGWQKLDLVRGLPRSEENHHSNGMALVGSTLYLAAGGNTNMGAMSNNFALLPEYALSAAILSIDLEQIGDSTYDLPTLDDEDRPGIKDDNDPFGGNGGKNQAMLVEGGPVQVYAPGLRNPYDVVVMQNGKMYSWDNGPNSGWGGKPSNCSNARQEPGATQHDALHLISGPGYYGGHPNPTRGSQTNTFNSSNPQSPVPYANPVECNYYGPGIRGNGKHANNHSLVSLPRSTNGLTEYTASNLSGAMTGNLIAVSWDNKVYKLSFKASGELNEMQVLFSNVGISPLDITAQSDSSIFPGTIWVADLQSNHIVVFEPDDYEGGAGIGVCFASGGSGDADNDGFSNDDEIANGTDSCSAADFPADADGDRISDLIDNDDDNDQILDVDDPFAIDASNGATTPLPVDYQWENDSPDPGFIANLGFTGLMTNGMDDYQAQYDLNEMTIVGAAGVVTVDNVPSGDPIVNYNSQKYGFQFGVDVSASSQIFRAQTRILSPFSGFSPKLHQSMGLFIGTGDQDNYVKLIVKHNSVQLLSEVEGELYYQLTNSVPLSGSDYVDLTIQVDPASAIATAFFQINKNGLTEQEVEVATVDFPASWLSGATRLAVGIISTSIGAQPFPATWDFITVKPLDDNAANQAPTVTIPAVIDVTAGMQKQVGAIVTDDDLPAGSLNYQWSQLSGPAPVAFVDSSTASTAMTFSKVGDYVLQLAVNDGELTGTDTVDVNVAAAAKSEGNVVYRINAGGPLLTAADGNWQSDSASSEYYNTGMTWQTSAAIDVSGISTGAPAQLFKTERYDRPEGPELEWKLPVTPGDYVVRLYFSEIYFGTMKNGGRVFSASVEGQSQTGIDVFASVGANKAMMQSFSVQADDTINIRLTRITQNPAIKGIEVLRRDDSAAPPDNQPPVVSAGADLEAKAFVAVNLSGTVTDDGFPVNNTSIDWSLVSGPAAPNFSAQNGAVTQVEFPVAGIYVLRLKANDGELTASDDVQITVTAADVVANTAPVVTAGADKTTSVSAPVNLSGFVSDDELPVNSIQVIWSKQSGPAGVQFDNVNSASTTATFSQAGQYVLRLSATDTMLSGFDEVTITVKDVLPGPSAVYRINAGGPAIPDANGDWSADAGSYSLANTGNVFSTGFAINTSMTPGIPANLFQSERWDRQGGADLQWKLPVTPGNYDVHLYFSEIYAGTMGNGKRVFDVSVEGQALSALDVYAEAGSHTALVRTFSVENTDGVINIIFDHIVENPAIKGIEVVARY